MDNKNLDDMTRDELYKHLLSLSPEKAKGQSRGKKEELLRRIGEHYKEVQAEAAFEEIIDEIIAEEQAEKDFAPDQQLAKLDDAVTGGVEAAEMLETVLDLESGIDETKLHHVAVVGDGGQSLRQLGGALAAKLDAVGVLLFESTDHEEMRALLASRGVDMTPEVLLTVENLAAAIGEHPDVDSFDDLFARIGDERSENLRKSADALSAMFRTEEVVHDHGDAPAGPQKTAKDLVHKLLRQEPELLSQMKLPTKLYDTLRAAQGVNPRGNRKQRRKLSTLLKSAYTATAKALASKQIVLHIS